MLEYDWLLTALIYGLRWLPIVFLTARELVLKSRDGVSFKKSTHKSRATSTTASNSHWSNFTNHHCSFPIHGVSFPSSEIYLQICVLIFPKTIYRVVRISNKRVAQAGLQYACACGRLEIVWRHKDGKEGNMSSVFSCFLRWNFFKVGIVHDIDAFFTI